MLFAGAWSSRGFTIKKSFPSLCHDFSQSPLLAWALFSMVLSVSIVAPPGVGVLSAAHYSVFIIIRLILPLPISRSFGSCLGLLAHS